VFLSAFVVVGLGFPRFDAPAAAAGPLVRRMDLAWRPAAWARDWAGLHFMVGAFISGVVMESRLGSTTAAWTPFGTTCCSCSCGVSLSTACAPNGRWRRAGFVARRGVAGGGGRRKNCSPRNWREVPALAAGRGLLVGWLLQTRR